MVVMPMGLAASSELVDRHPISSAVQGPLR